MRSPGPVLRAAISRVELRWLVIVCVLAGSAWAFIELADEMGEKETHGTDVRILLALRDSDHPTDPGPPWIVEVARDLTALGGLAALSLATCAAAGYLATLRRIRDVVVLVAAVVVGALSCQLLKLGFDRPRPEIVPHLARSYTASFPSGHAMMSTVTYLTLAGLLARQQVKRTKVMLLAWAVFMSALVGVSRVYLGVHWPTDVLAGWVAGGFWALLCWAVAEWLDASTRNSA